MDPSPENTSPTPQNSSKPIPTPPAPASELDKTIVQASASDAETADDGTVRPTPSVGDKNARGVRFERGQIELRKNLEELTERFEKETGSLRSGMEEMLTLLRGKNFNEPEVRPTARSEDEAMNEIDSISMPALSATPSVAARHTGFSDLQELNQNALKSPVFLGASELSLRNYLSDLEIWHIIVTNPKYRNKLSTFEVVRQLQLANSPKTHHASKFQAFWQAVQELITKEALLASGEDLDDELWAKYITAFKAFLMPDAVDEKNAIFMKVFYKTRPRQSSIISSITLFKQLATQLCALDAPSLKFSEYMSPQLYASALMRYLDLAHPALDPFRRRLVKKLDEGVDHADLLEWLLTQQGVDKLALQERPGGKRTFLADSSEYGDTKKFEAGGGSGHSVDDGDIQEFALPAVVNTSSNDNISNTHTQDDYHSKANMSLLTKQKVFIGENTFEYDPQAVLTTHFANSKSNGLNKFPKDWKKGNRSNAANRKSLAKALANQVGSACTRCLRASCSGSTTGWRDAPCAQEGSPEFVSYALCQVLFHLVKYMFGENTKEHSKTAVKNFYLQNGARITTDKASSVASMQTWLVKVVSTCYLTCAPDYYTSLTKYVSFSAQSDDTDAAREYRSLRAMPDIGCPEYIAGLCWWRDYQVALQAADLLKGISYGEAPGTYAFGDSTPKSACYRVCQVPLFYKKAKKPSESLIVFANITIVTNEVGLLNGKGDLSALDMKAQLKSPNGASKFWLSNSEISVYDAGSHFWLLLNHPRAFGDNEKAISLQRMSTERAVAVSVIACDHHSLSQSFDKNVQVCGDKKHITLTSSANQHGTLEESSDTSCQSSATDIDIGVFDEITGPEGCYLDTDSEYEYDTEHESFVKVLSHAEESPTAYQGSEDCPIKSFTIFAVSLSEVELSEDKTTELIARIWELHKKLNHPAPSQLLVLLQNSMPENVKLPAAVSQAVRKLNCPRCLRDSKRVPERPSVSAAVCTAPGQVADMDTGSFECPSGKVTGVVHVDEFSGKISGGLFSMAKPTAEAMIRMYVEIVDEHYENVLVDLEGCFDSQQFSTFLEKQGTGLRFVPTGAHWANKAEKAVGLVKGELVSVFAEHPELPNDLAFKLALLSVNRRVMPQYKISRLELHWGRKTPTANLHELPLSVLTDVPLAPSLADVDEFMDGVSKKRKEKLRKEARLRLHHATKGRFPAEQVQIGNGDEFLIFHNDPVSKTKSGFRGVFICLGQVRSLIVGMRGRYIVTAHPSRVLLHRRADHELKLSVKSDGVLPQKRTVAWEERLSQPEFDEFLRTMEHSTLPESPAREELPKWEAAGSPVDDPAFSGAGALGDIFDKNIDNTELFPITDIDIADSNLPVIPPVPSVPEIDHVEDIVMPDLQVDALTGQPTNPLPLSLFETSAANGLEDLQMPGEDGNDLLLSDAREKNSITDKDGVALEALGTADTIRHEDDSSLAAQAVADTPVSAALTDRLSNDWAVENNDISTQVDELHPSPLEIQPNGSSEEPRLTDIENQLLSQLEEIGNLPSLDQELLGSENNELDFIVDDGSPLQSETRKRTREDQNNSDEPVLSRQRTFVCPEVGDVELERRLYEAKKRYRQNTPTKQSYQRPGQHPNGQAQSETLLNPNCEASGSEVTYVVSATGIALKRIFLCDTRRKRTVVHDYSEAIRLPGMKAAMDLEINTFKKFGVLEEKRLCDLPGDTNLVSTRWILSTKTNPDGTKKRKARLVARGFEDSEKDNISRDSPVASNATQRLVLQLLAEKQWIPQSYDFLSAFLQGKLLDRVVVIAPPKEFDIPEDVVWVIKKPIYGLCSAPKAWYDALLEVCLAEGFDTQVSDEGILRLRGRNGILVGILALHVDDAIGGGTEALTRVMKKVGEQLLIGSHETASNENGFFYKGLKVSVMHHYSGKLKGNFEILLDGNDYLDSVLKMNEPSGPDERFLNPKESTEFKSVAGCVGYMASAFRCDLSVETSMLGRSFFAPTVNCAKKANAVVEYAKENRYVLSFRPGVEKLLVFADAAGPNAEGTQGGRIYCFADLDSEKIAGFAHWESRKNSRVCRSTSTAEILTVGDAIDSAIWLQQLWFELSGSKIPIEIVTDSHGTLKNSVTTKLPTERRNRIDMALIRQALRRGEIALTWVPSRANIADSLTKESDSRAPVRTPDKKLKKVLLDSLMTNNSQLKGVQRVTRTTEDVSRY